MAATTRSPIRPRTHAAKVGVAKARDAKQIAYETVRRWINVDGLTPKEAFKKSKESADVMDVGKSAYYAWLKNGSKLGTQGGLAMCASAEEALVAFLLLLSDLSFGLDAEWVRAAACVFAADDEESRGWESDDKGPLAEWIQSFRARHDAVLGHRFGEVCDGSRTTAMDCLTVEQWFDKYEAVIKKFELKPWQVWNADETGACDRGSKDKTARRIFCTGGALYMIHCVYHSELTLSAA